MRTKLELPEYTDWEAMNSSPYCTDFWRRFQGHTYVASRGTRSSERPFTLEEDDVTVIDHDPTGRGGFIFFEDLADISAWLGEQREVQARAAKAAEQALRDA